MIETNISNEQEKECLLKRMALFLESIFDDTLINYQIKPNNSDEAISKELMSKMVKD